MYTSRLLDEISDFVQNEASSSLLRLLFTKDRRACRIECYYKRICTVIQSFHASYKVVEITSLTDTSGKQQVSGMLKIEEWKTRNIDVQAADQHALQILLSKLETNHHRLKDALSKLCR
jgi:hypothetical protein